MGNCASKSNIRKSLKQGSAILRPKKSEIKLANFRLHYKIVEKIVDEPEATVFLLTDKVTSEKRILRSITIEEETLGYIQSEVQELQKLDHPNLVNIVDVYLEAHFLNVISEYCSGGELFEKITKTASFSQDLLIKYMKQIASGLIYLHNLGIVHKHLAPEEILFVDDSENSALKITGIGRSYDEKSCKLYRAPETFSDNYQKSSDIWSLGVILYILACGRPPFKDLSKEQEFLLEINTNKPSFTERGWNRFSPGFKNLVSSMLTKDFKERPSAQEIFESEIVLETQTEEKTRISGRALNRLSKFTKKSKFKRALLAFLLHKTSINNKVNHFISIFKSMDTNGDGILSTEEILEGLKSTGVVISNPIQIIKSIDTDKSGSVSYSEFITALVDWEKELSYEKLTKAFMELDTNGDGVISAEEFVNAIGDNVEEKELSRFMKEADTNEDGCIDFKEFCEYLTKQD